MKHLIKPIFSFALLVLITLAGAPFVSAEGTAGTAGTSIVEKPNIDIYIEGVQKAYADVPIIVDGSTLLPLRAVLTDLGVPNDDAHILWNGADQSVTVKKDATVIFLKVGAKQAMLNGAPIELTSAPVNYKGRVYIPTRFVAQSLGKKVIWDENGRGIFIRDEKSYNEVKDILDKAVAASAKMVKYKIAVELKVSNGDKSIVMLKGNIAVDRQNRMVTSHADMPSEEMQKTYGMSGGSDAYLYKGVLYDTEYSKTPKVKMLSDEEIDEEIYKYVFTDILSVEDILYSGLTVERDTQKGVIRLKGNMCLTRQKPYAEITIDADTFDVLSIYMKQASFPNGVEETANMTSETTVTFSDFDGKFEIKIPDEVLKVIDAKIKEEKQ